MIDPLGGPAYWVPFIVGFVVAYLIGSVPFGLILTRLAGAGDVREIGSGNIGATNVLRTGRKGLALATLALDVLKGALPVWLAYRYLGPDMAVVAGLGAVLGHCFPIWLKFRGGKGVATAAGVVVALTPLVAAIARRRVRADRARDPLRLARLDAGRDRRGACRLSHGPRPGGRAVPAAGAAHRAQARRQHPPPGRRGPNPAPEPAPLARFGVTPRSLSG